MTNEKILVKAIAKAVKSGWNPPSIGKIVHTKFTVEAFRIWLLFDPEWAKAFWHYPEEMRCDSPKCDAKQCEYAGWHNWETEQQCLLLEIQQGRDPIKYLEQFL